MAINGSLTAYATHLFKVVLGVHDVTDEFPVSPVIVWPRRTPMSVPGVRPLGGLKKRWLDVKDMIASVCTAEDVKDHAKWSRLGRETDPGDIRRDC